MVYFYGIRSDPKGPFSEDVLAIVRRVEVSLDLDTGIGPEDVLVYDEYISGGYGVVGWEVAEVIRRLFQSEGFVLDPVYTLKAMVGLLDLVRKGIIRKDETIVFFHTGGTPVLFPLGDMIVKLLDAGG